MLINDLLITSMLDSFISHYKLKIESDSNKILVLCKDIVQVDKLVQIFKHRRSYFSVESYHDVLVSRKDGFMGRKELLHLAKRNNAGLQSLDGANLERIIRQNKRIKK